MVALLAACGPGSTTTRTQTSPAATDDDTTNGESDGTEQPTGTATDGTTPDSSGSPTGGLQPMADRDDPVTFTVFIRDPNMAPASSNPVLQHITELTGVTLKFEFLVGDLDQKLGVMITGGDYPDAIFAGDAASKLIEAQAFIPLEDKLPNYENLMKLYRKNLKLMTAEDGHIYNLELYNVTNNDVTEAAPIFEAGIGFYIQKAVLEEAGYPTPRTIDEYFDLLLDYKEKHPEIDGVQTIGFEVLADGWRNWALVNPPQHLLGGGNDGALFVDPNTMKSSFFQTSDTAHDFYKKLNEMYHKGLIEPETFTQNYDQYIARISTGAVLGFFDQLWNFQSAQNVLKDDGKHERSYITVPIANEGVQDGYLDEPSGNVTGVNGIGITVNCEQPERLLAFYDWLLEREVQDYLQWGEEGTDWTATESGKVLTAERRRITYDVAQNRDLTGQTLWNYSPKWQGLYLDDGQPCGPGESADEFLASQSDYDRSFLKEYGFRYPAEIMSAPVKRAPYFPVWAMTLEDGSPAAVSATKVTDSTMKYYPRLILAGSDEEFESLWAEFVDDFNSIDLEAYQSEIDRQIQIKNDKGASGD